MNESSLDIREGYKEKYGFHDDIAPIFKSRRGLDRDVVAEISAMKKEPAWMRDFRLKALEQFEKKPLPNWGGNVGEIDFQNIFYYLKPTDEQGKNWEDVPADIKRTFDKLGIPEAEQKFLSGVGAQYDSETVYHKIKEDLANKGVIFLDTGSALEQHPDLFRQYFGTIIPPSDNKFAALNSAVWSGGSFIYVPKGVKVDLPLQAYFRINAQNMGQFERTLIIVDEGAFVHYVEGCTAPIYASDSLHAAVVEIIVKKGARCRYTTIQNWSNNVFNLVTKRAAAYQDATMEWVDANLGSKLTMKYPSVYMMEPGAHAEILSIAFAGKGQHQDAGGKCVRGLQHHLQRRLQVDQQGRGPGRLSRARQGGEGRDQLQVDGALRRASPGRGLPLRHLSVHGDRGGQGLDRSRGDGLEDRRRAALLSHEPRHSGGGSGRDDRERVHRADHEGAADGVRRRDEPPDPASDGGLGRLSAGPPRTP
jgi:Fe-S cluster assembly protein SufB